MLKVCKNIILALCLSCCLPLTAFAQTISYQTDSQDIYVGFPFTLSLVLDGFEDEPKPTLPTPKIEGANVQFVGVTPQISRMTSIINGQRTDKKTVVYYFNYQVTAPKAGTYTIQPVVAEQDGRSVESKTATFTAVDVPETRDMLLNFVLPNRTVLVGESFEAYVDLYLRSDLSNFRFNLPILQRKDDFDITIPQPGPNENVLGGSNTNAISKMPYSSSLVTYQGMRYTRYRFRMIVLPLKAGEFTIAPVSVFARTSDSFGFGFFDEPSSAKVYKAESSELKFSVKQLPPGPPTFSNAIGEAFTLKVTADRTVVKVGDPINLTFAITGKNMDYVDLPKLEALTPDFFSVSRDAIQSRVENASDGLQTKYFIVPARIKSLKVREIPPIAFSFYNPKDERYETIRSTPIAVSVSDVQRIGAADVVDASNAKVQPAAGSPSRSSNQKNEPTSGNLTNGDLAALDLGLSPISPSKSLNASLASFPVWPIYASPFIFWALFLLVSARRTKQKRFASQRQAISEFTRALDGAANMTYDQASPVVVNATQKLCSACQIKSDAAEIKSAVRELEDIAYNPNKKREKPEKNTFDSLKSAISTNIPEIYKHLLPFLILLSLLLPSQLHAEPSQLNEARNAYDQALATSNLEQKVGLFKKSATLFESLAEKDPHNAALWQDYGHASLNARELGQAVLAYRRALKLDPTLKASQKNLAYLRGVLGSDVQSSESSMMKFFFINTIWSTHTRLLIAALLFALAGLLLIPWTKKQGVLQALRFGAVVAAILWVWMLSSVYGVPDRDHDAVVTSQTTLKVADSLGASNASNSPLSTGTEVRVLEMRNGWARIELPDTQTGWVQLSAVSFVALR